MMIDPNHELDGHGCFTPLERIRLLALRDLVDQGARTDWPDEPRPNHEWRMCDPRLPRADGVPLAWVRDWLRWLEAWLHAKLAEDAQGTWDGEQWGKAA